MQPPIHRTGVPNCRTKALVLEQTALSCADALNHPAWQISNL